MRKLGEFFLTLAMDYILLCLAVSTARSRGSIVERVLASSLSAAPNISWFYVNRYPYAAFLNM